MASLGEILSPALRRSPASDWATAADLEALGGARLTPRAAVVIGRLLRATDLREGERQALDEWLAQTASAWDDVARETRAELDRIEVDVAAERIPPESVRRRDDVESRLVALGRAVVTSSGAAALAGEERSIAARASAVDALASARIADVTEAPVDSWILRASGLDAGTWWLDAVAVAALRHRTGRVAWPSAGRQARPPVRLSLASAAPLTPEVIGCEDDLAAIGEAYGTLVARLFDGEVEVFAIGLRESDGIEPGLWVRRRGGGGDTDLDAVVAPGAASEPSRSPSGWWVPLARSVGPTEITVRLRSGEQAAEERIAVVSG